MMNGVPSDAIAGTISEVFFAAKQFGGTSVIKDRIAKQLAAHTTVAVSYAI